MIGCTNVILMSNSRPSVCVCVFEVYWSMYVIEGRFNEEKLGHSREAWFGIVLQFISHDSVFVKTLNWKKRVTVCELN